MVFRKNQVAVLLPVGYLVLETGDGSEMATKRNANKDMILRYYLQYVVCIMCPSPTNTLDIHRMASRLGMNLQLDPFRCGLSGLMTLEHKSRRCFHCGLCSALSFAGSRPHQCSRVAALSAANGDGKEAAKLTRWCR